MTACSNPLISLLIIDDNLGSLELLSSALKQPELDILTADDPQEGLEMVYRMRPQIVLTDLVMPKLSGLEVLDLAAGDGGAPGADVYAEKLVDDLPQIARGLQAGIVIRSTGGPLLRLSQALRPRTAPLPYVQGQRQDELNTSKTLPWDFEASCVERVRDFSESWSFSIAQFQRPQAA